MSTTRQLIPMAQNGFRDSTGAPIASGLLRAYQPATTTPIVVYDAAESGGGAVSQPVTLDAGGRYPGLAAGVACRIVVKDPTDTTTLYDENWIPAAADNVYVTAAGFNGGSETTLQTILNTANTSFGAGFQYDPTPTASPVNVYSAIREHGLSIASYGATPGGADCATAIQNCLNDCRDYDVPMIIPQGEFYTSTGFTWSSSKSLVVRGMGKRRSLIRMTGSVQLFVLSAGDGHEFSDFGVRASSSVAGAVFASATTGVDDVSICRVDLTADAGSSFDYFVQGKGAAANDHARWRIDSCDVDTRTSAIYRVGAFPRIVNNTFRKSSATSSGLPCISDGSIADDSGLVIGNLFVDPLTASRWGQCVSIVGGSRWTITGNQFGTSASYGGVVASGTPTCLVYAFNGAACFGNVGGGAQHLFYGALANNQSPITDTWISSAAVAGNSTQTPDFAGADCIAYNINSSGGGTLTINTPINVTANTGSGRQIRLAIKNTTVSANTVTFASSWTKGITSLSIPASTGWAVLTITSQLYVAGMVGNATISVPTTPTW